MNDAHQKYAHMDLGYISVIKLGDITGVKAQYVIAHGFTDSTDVYMESLVNRKPTLIFTEHLNDNNYLTCIGAIRLRLKYRNCIPVTTSNGLQLEDGYMGDDIIEYIIEIIRLSKIRWKVYTPLYGCGTHATSPGTERYNMYEIVSMIKFNQ